MICGLSKRLFGRAASLAARAGHADVLIESLEQRTMLSADLTVLPISGSGVFPSSTGGALLVSGGVHNGGDSGADGFVTRIVLSRDRVYGNADDVELGVVNDHGPGGIGAGGTFDLNRTLTVPAGVAPGAYFLIASTDTGGAVLESDEGNNTAVSEAPLVVINGAAGGPNLVISVTSPVVTVSDDDHAEDSHFTATTTVRNLGTGSPNDFRIVWVLTRDSIIGNEDDIVIEEDDVSRTGGIGPGGSYIVTDEFDFPAGVPAGAYRLGARVDWTGVIGESDESDNTALSAGTGIVVNGGAGNPNLTVTVSTPAVTLPGDLREDLHFTGTATVRNTGTGSPGEFRMTWILTRDAIVGNGDDIVIENEDYHFPGGVAAGTPVVVNQELEIPAGTPAGSYRLAVRIDGTGVVSETNETDNTGISGAAVNVSRPDLSGAFAYTGGTFAPGSSITGTLTLRNAGLAASGGFHVTISLSTDATAGNGDDIVLLRYNVEDPGNDDLGLAAGATQTVSDLRLPVSFGVAPGTYRVVVRIDSDDSVGESSESNNSTVSALPNIVVPARDTSADPALPDLGVFAYPVIGTFAPGATVTIPALIANFGGASASNFDVRVYLSLDGTLDAGDVLIEGDLEFNDDNFVPGGVYVRNNITLPLTLAAGNYNVILVVDEDNRVGETGDDNNRNRSGTSGSTRVTRPVVTVEVQDGSGAETSGGQAANGAAFRFRRSGSTSGPLTVSYTIGGTAAAGDDYTPLTGTVTFAPGQSTVTVPVGVVSDDTAEENESVSVTLLDGASAGYGLGSTPSRSSSVTILANGPVVSVTRQAASVSEGRTGTQPPAVFRVSRTGSTTAPLTVRFSLDGTAVLGDDYTENGASNALHDGLVTIPAGASFVEVRAVPVNDGLVEPSETVGLTLTADPTYRQAAAVAQRSATVTITDDEPTVRVTMSDATAGERASGSPDTATYTFARTGVTGSPLVVRFRVAPGSTATYGADYTLATTTAGATLNYDSGTGEGTLTIPAGAGSANVVLTTALDTVVEAQETVIVDLLAGTGLAQEYRTSLTQATATGRINNLLFADASVSQIVSVTPTTLTAGAAGQSIGFVVDLMNLGTSTITQFTGTFFLTTAGGVRINLGTRTFTGSYGPATGPRVEASFSLAGIRGLVAGTYTPGVVITTGGDARTGNNTLSDASQPVTFI